MVLANATAANRTRVIWQNLLHELSPPAPTLDAGVPKLTIEECGHKRQDERKGYTCTTTKKKKG